MKLTVKTDLALNRAQRDELEEMIGLYLEMQEPHTPRVAQ